MRVPHVPDHRPPRQLRAAARASELDLSPQVSQERAEYGQMSEPAAQRSGPFKCPRFADARREVAEDADRAGRVRPGRARQRDGGVQSHRRGQMAVAEKRAKRLDQ